MKKYLLHIFLGINILLISCGPSEMKASDLIRYVENEENGLFQKKTLPNYSFEAQLKPLDYIVAIELKTDEVKEDEYEKIHEEIKGLEYYNLKIGGLQNDQNALSSGALSDDEYFARLDYFLTYAINDIMLVAESDTLLPTLYHFERNYGISPKNTILLGFETSEPYSEDRTLIVDDQVLGVGRVKFHFKKENIKNLPQLKRS